MADPKGLKMAPQKRKNNDDLIYTIDDDDPVDYAGEELAPPPRKRTKASDENVGIWGENDDDDGAMDPAFEFVIEGASRADVGDVDLDGWGFEGAKKAINGGADSETKGADIDEIIRRMREEKKDKGPKSQANPEHDALEEHDADALAAQITLDDEDDEVLADDAFGMGADSSAEETDDDSDGNNAKVDDDSDVDGGESEDEGATASESDSAAEPVNHPDDDAASSDAESESDPEEEAKRNEFFAPKEELVGKPGKRGDISFMDMDLSRPILRGLTSVGFSKPTPIQAKTIPITLMGKDLVGGAVTGSGKTAAFVVPILERLLYRPRRVPVSRVVILTPTRELAMQCHAVSVKLACHTDVKFCLAVGGLSLKAQEAELRLRPDVIIATPGRFIDHMRNSPSFAVDGIEILVLDEADRMLEDGFADELNEILTTLPKRRQTMLFSATMTSSVDRLIRVGMNKPMRVMVDSQKQTVGTLVQEFVRLRPGRDDKRMGYLIHLCKKLYTERVIIFFRQKKAAHHARIVFRLLDLSCAELHGSMNQAQRIASVEDFRDGKVSFLLATDLASRGLDIKGVSTVINYEAPQTLEIYVHRVGRTARAGRAGIAVTLAAEADRKVVKAAVKMAKAQQGGTGATAKVRSRVIEREDADQWQARVDELADEMAEIERLEKTERQIAQAEMQVTKGENMIRHEAEIKGRPRRTWFETQHDKKAARTAGMRELNGGVDRERDRLKNKKGGRLSNKDKKKLDTKAERLDKRAWKKGRPERDVRGAVLNLKRKKRKGTSGKGFKKV